MVCRCVSFTVPALYQIKMGLAAAKEIIGLKPPDKVILITIAVPISSGSIDFADQVSCQWDNYGFWPPSKYPWKYKVSSLDLLNLPRLDKISIKKSFDRAARSYDRAAILQAEVLSRLLARLEYIRHNPGAVIDIGCGTGKGIAGLQKKYPRSKIVGLDLAFSMLQASRKQVGFLRRKRLVNSDMENMPFAEGSFDLLFSNLALEWVNDIGATFKEIYRIGRPGSLLMFATFGPGTLKELRDSWSRIDQNPHVHQFIDMHDIGDAMVANGFQQPVVDAEIIRLEYKEFRQVFDDLKNTGAINADKGRGRGLITPTKLKRLEIYYRQLGYEQGKFIASYEVLYGHAWVP